jgi:uncharacterized protein YndB with AHSA1/START domain
MAKTAEQGAQAKPLELTIVRMFDAPRELIWACWTENEHASQWGPEGFEVTSLLQELHVGGKWRVRLRATDGSRDMYQGGVYREVKQPERLVFTFAWEGEGEKEMLVSLDFREVNGKTEMTFTQAGFPSIEERDGHEEGWGQAFDALGAYAERRHAATKAK